MNASGEMPHVWLTRAGAHGQDEDVALDEQLAVIGFREVGDLRNFASPEEIVLALIEVDPNPNKRRAQTQARQLWAFRSGIAQGDIVVLPFKTRKGQVAVGTVVGDYDYRTVAGEVRHTRLVNWLRPGVSRTAFGQELLYCLGARLAVCRITRHDAEARVLTILNGGGDPGFKEEGPPSKVAAPNSDADAGVIFDIARTAHDEIALFVRDRYRRHDLARLVEAVLQADGFQTHRLALGPDGGADFLAGKGSLGLDLPTLCVQVRATEAPADVHIFRALQGTMATFGAQHGLLVCWGGFTTFLKSEARQHSFEIRLWDQSDILQAVYGTYERLPEEIQAELPLKRIWALVREETEIEG